jgi:hypothetical protein
VNAVGRFVDQNLFLARDCLGGSPTPQLADTSTLVAPRVQALTVTLRCRVSLGFAGALTVPVLDINASATAAAGLAASSGGLDFQNPQLGNVDTDPLLVRLIQ